MRLCLLMIGLSLVVIVTGCRRRPTLELDKDQMLSGEGIILGGTKTRLLRAGSEVQTGSFPAVPADGRLAIPRPVELRSSGRGIAPERAGVTGIGPSWVVGDNTEERNIASRIFHYGSNCGADDLGPWPPEVPGLSFFAESPFVTSRLEVVAYRDLALVRYDPQTKMEVAIPVPPELVQSLMTTSHHPHWIDMLGRDGFVAQIGAELIYWTADGVIERSSLANSDPHQVKAHSNNPRYAATSQTSGLVVDRFFSPTRVHDLVRGKTAPSPSRILLHEGEWDPFGATFAYWSSEISGCRSNGVACNEVYDLVSYSSVLRERGVLVKHAAGYEAPWTWTDVSIFHCREAPLRINGP